MTKQHIMALVCSLGAAVVGACSDATAPTRTVSLALCGNVDWAAYKNSDGDWTRFASGPGSYDVRLTERVAIATAGGTQFATVFVDFLTAEQAEKRYTCASATPGTRVVDGAFADLSGSEIGYVTFGPGIESGSATKPDFTMGGLPAGPLDLVATRMIFGNGEFSVPDVIVRRALNPPDGGTLDVLDLASAEAFTPQVNTLTLTGLPAASLSVGAQSDFLTASGTDNPLGGAESRGGMIPIYSVPDDRLEATDLHSVNVGTGGGVGLNLLAYYHTPGDRTLAIGPLVNEPTFTPEGTSPALRVRADVASQQEYDRSITVALFQVNNSTFQYRTTSMHATSEYFGGRPPTWTLTTPDFTAVEGFNSAWALEPIDYNWFVGVSRFPFGFSQHGANDGDVFRSASLFHSSLSSAGVMSGLQRQELERVRQHWGDATLSFPRR
jgi:hypothetical protein